MPSIVRFDKMPALLRFILEPLRTIFESVLLVPALIFPPVLLVKFVPSKFKSLFKLKAFELLKLSVIFPLPE